MYPDIPWKSVAIRDNPWRPVSTRDHRVISIENCVACLVCSSKTIKDDMDSVDCETDLPRFSRTCLLITNTAASNYSIQSFLWACMLEFGDQRQTLCCTRICACAACSSCPCDKKGRIDTGIIFIIVCPTCQVIAGGERISIKVWEGWRQKVQWGESKGQRGSRTLDCCPATGTVRWDSPYGQLVDSQSEWSSWYWWEGAVDLRYGAGPAYETIML